MKINITTLATQGLEGDLQKGVSAAYAALIGEDLLVAGGCNFPDKLGFEGGKKVFYEAILHFDKSKNQWQTIGKLPEAAAYGVSVAIPDGYLWIGGQTATNSLATCHKVQYSKEKGLTLTDFLALPEPLDNFAGASVGSKVFVAGGNASGKASNKVFYIDAATDKQWKQLPDFPGEARVQPVLAAIEKARNVEARRLLFALNIPLVGQDVCNRLLSAYPLEELIKTATESAVEDVFSTIAGIGPEKSASFVRWMKDKDNQSMLQHLLAELNVSQPSSAPTGDSCQGLTFVVTGDVHHYKNRNELKAYIESQGGKVTGSVSKSTNYLINNDVESTSGKNQKAKELSIPIISEDEFIARFTQVTAPETPSQPTEGSLF